MYIIHVTIIHVLRVCNSYLYSSPFNPSLLHHSLPHYPSTPRPLSLYATPTPVPAQVQNVRVYVFYPIRNDTSLVTAQVVWDGLSVEEAGGMLTGYSIDILNASDMSPVTASNVLVSGRVCV